MAVSVYRPARSAVQSGRADTKRSVLEFEPTDRPKVDPLMGRLGSTDNRKQVRRSFPTGGSAIASAERRGWDGTACTLRERTARPKSYAERFTAGITRAAA